MQIFSPLFTMTAVHYTVSSWIRRPDLLCEWRRTRMCSLLFIIYLVFIIAIRSPRSENKWQWKHLLWSQFNPSTVTTYTHKSIILQSLCLIIKEFNTQRRWKWYNETNQRCARLQPVGRAGGGDVETADVSLILMYKQPNTVSVLSKECSC